MATNNKGLNNIIETLSKIHYQSYARLQANANIKLNFKRKQHTYSPLFKQLIDRVSHIKKKITHMKKKPIIETHSPPPLFTPPVPLKPYITNSKNDIKKDNNKNVKREYINKYSQRNILGIFKGFIKEDFIQLSILKRKTDFYSQVFFRALNTELDVFLDKEMAEYLKNIKYKVIESFYSRDLYKRLDYSSKYFKKSELDNVFANNLNISRHMLRVYGDVFNVNVVFIDSENIITFLTFYDTEKATVIISEDDNRIYTLRNKVGAFIKGKEFNKYLSDRHNYKRFELDKFNISQLQNICKYRNIDYKKQGKTKRINQTKKELIDKISSN